ncbi:hypothetical protein OIU84_006910 [Salix udensis]|uniref:Uncharacterized protein n=1 Tax=Salix udensis TaxID=889485 RepID=A0AAD6P2L6_9ROSI|nr:hypothetical protein OIU84_006910 [Salix udensis]
MRDTNTPSSQSATKNMWAQMGWMQVERPSVPSAYGGAFDIAYMAPSDEAELMHNVATAAAIDDTEPAASGSHGQWDWNISISEQQSNRTGGQKSDKWGNCLL